MNDFGSGIAQYGPMHERSGRASKEDLRRRIAVLEDRDALHCAIIDEDTKRIAELEAEVKARDLCIDAWKAELERERNKRCGTCKHHPGCLIESELRLSDRFGGFMSIGCTEWET